MPRTAEPYFGRLIPAMVTPFDKEGEVDVAQAVKLARKLVDGGCDSVLVFGTTGEGPTVHAEKKLEVFKAVAEGLAGTGAKVIANVGSNCTADTIEFAKQAQATGVDGLLVVVPYYNKPPQEGLYQHYAAIVRAVDLPILIYNIPGRTSRNMEAETQLRLARDFDNIVGVKEASGDLAQIEAVCNGAPEGFSVYSGDDALTLEVMKRGGVGVISTTANVAPAAFKEIVALAAEGNWDAAEQANEKLLPLMKELFVAPNPIMVKEALNLTGFYVGGVRLPLVRATQEQSDELAGVLREVGALK